MAKVIFENGTVVEFDGTPTTQDIEYVANKLSIKNGYQKTTQTTPDIGTIKQGQKADAFLNKGIEQQLQSKEFLKEIPGGIAQTLIGTPLKFLASAAESIPTAIRGKSTQKEYKVPGLAPFKSYQSDAETRTGRAMDIEQTPSDLKANLMALQPFAEVPLAGVETAGIAKGLFGDITLTGKNAGKVTPGLLQKGISARKNFITKTGEQNATKNAIKAITPTVKDLTPKQAIEAKKLGKIGTRGILKGEKYSLSNNELRIAKENADVLTGKNASENIDNVGDRVKELDESVGSYLEQKNQIFSSQRLRETLNKKIGGLGEGIGTNQKSVDDFVNKLVSDSNGNLYDAWKARKAFDNYADDYLRAFSGNPTLKKDMAKATRNAMQEFITSELSDDVYKPAMKKMSDLLKLVDEDNGLLTRKYLGERGLSGLSVLIKKHPTFFRGLKWLGYFGLAGTGIKAFRE